MDVLDLNSMINYIAHEKYKKLFRAKIVRQSLYFILIYLSIINTVI